MSNLIAIVGRPNVGKSALFNRIVGKRIAIVHDQPGVTRDRVTAEAEWQGHAFTLVDTGGIGLLRGEKTADVIVKAAMEQVELAIEAANVIILVVNVQEGVVPLDREAAERLRKSGKPVFVAANKADTERAQKDADEFADLGFDQVFAVSAIHGHGVNELMDAAMANVGQASRLPAEGAAIGEEPLERNAPPGEAGGADGRDARPTLKLAIVGRPNVGKSSIINALTKSARVIVTPIPGTTRDAIDVPFEVKAQGGDGGVAATEKYILIDTAGMRKPRRVGDSIEFFSVQRAEDSIARSDIVVLVLDAQMGIAERDKKIADVIVGHHKACIVVVNKWDLCAEKVRQARAEEIARRQRRERRWSSSLSLPEDTLKRELHQAGRHTRAPKVMSTLGEFGAWVQEKLFFLDYAPVIFTSAVSGFNLDRLLEAVRYVAAQLRQKIPTAILNRTLHDAVERRQPVSSAGHRLKFFYATQVKQAPPTFLLFVNREELFSEPYKKYLANELRRAFGYEGCPLVLVPKARPKTIEPVRRQKPFRKQKRESGKSRGNFIHRRE